MIRYSKWKINLVLITGTKTLMNAKESSKVGNQRLQRAVKKKIVEEKENKVKLPQIDVKKRGKNSKRTSKEESCQDDVNITIEELVPPLVSIFIPVFI